MAKNILMEMIIIRIHKFGGSCLRDPKGFQRLTDIISIEEKPILVTVSASYGVTQYLIDVLDSPIDQLNIPTIIAHLQEIHLNLFSTSNKNLFGLDEELRRLERLLYGISYTEEITPRTYDLILSFGERLAVHVVKKYFTERNMTSIIVDPANLIRTNGIYKTSTILLEETEKICEEFKQNTRLGETILIVPGYFGSSHDKIVIPKEK